MQAEIQPSPTWQSYEESPTMTFQVALIGCDGLVVGSDRRVLFRSPSPDLVGPRPAAWQSLPGTKFIKSEDDTLVCACAGGPQSRSIATAFIAEWEQCRTARQIEWENRLRTTAEAVLGNSVGDEIIVVRKDQPARVLIVTRNNRDVGIQPIESTICTGTALNARFLSAFLWQPTTAVSGLRRLALLSLGCAAKERPGEVGDGFDLMTLEAATNRMTWETFQPDDPYIKHLINLVSGNVRQSLFHDDGENPSN
jgi:hypothetical protein